MRVRFYYTPLRSVANIQRDMERTIQHWWDWHGPNQRAPRGVWIPPTDVYETATELVVKIDMAGTTDEEVDITLHPDLLVVSGRREDRKTPPPTVIHQMDIWYGDYQVQVPIPVPIDPDNADAKYENGLINITLRKAILEEQKPRKVTVTTPKASDQGA
jgi:HSP20 family molecular chaperone IbpA